MPQQFGLGKGLGALIQRPSQKILQEKNETQKILELSPESIHVNPYQPRKNFDESGMSDLIESIRIHGIIQPLLVTQSQEGYELISGERRLRAAKKLNLLAVPVIVRRAEDQEKLEIALIENIQRKNLNPLEEALAYAELIEDFHLTQEEVGKRVGKNRSTIANSLRILTIPESIQEAIAQGKISEGHARSIASLETAEEQIALFKKILEKNFTVRDVEYYVRVKKQKGNKTEKTKDSNLREKEELLEEKFSTKVTIQKQGRKGKIMIAFYSDEEFAHILDELLL